MAKRPAGSRASATNSLAASLALFDGTHSEVLEHIAATHAGEPKYLTRLIALGRDPRDNVQAAAIWLIRRAHRAGAGFTVAQSRGIIDLLLHATRWPMRLNLLQMLGSVRIAPEQLGPLIDLLLSAAADTNTFVRAWAFHGLIVVGSRQARHRTRIDRLISGALASDSAAVRARIRKSRALADQAARN